MLRANYIGAVIMLAAAAAASPAKADRASFPICGGGKRITCVVDGDTIWLRGEKIRLEGIDAPEISQPRCSGEAQLGERAKYALQDILNSNDFSVQRTGTDRYGRTLAELKIASTTAGQMLIDRALAKRWEGSKAKWC